MQPFRIHSLDYLRGLMAFAILIYHFSSWTFGAFAADTLLGRVGLYGVSVFYVLSGLTLFLMYHKSLHPDWRSLTVFGLKRLFRILPLLWLTVIATVILTPKLFDLRLLFLSLTGLFGFVEPAGGLGTGVWSIGNELVFYTIFPVLILLLQRHRYLFLGSCLLLFAVSLYFSFFTLQAGVRLQPQWGLYVNPLNQIILFAGGMLLGYFVTRKPNWTPAFSVALLGLVAASLLFMFYPISGDRIELVSGVTRVVFVLLTFLICYFFYTIPFRLKRWLHYPLALTGEISYGLYLLHPLVYLVVFGAAKVLKLAIPPFFLIFVTIALAFITSYLIFRFFEKPWINLGKQLTTKILLKA